MLNKESFRELLGTYYDKFSPLFDNGEMEKIYSHLKNRSREGYKILPESLDVFRAFAECPYDKLRVMFCALAPYHSLRQGTVVADGILMSCRNTDVLQPSLANFYSAMEKEYKDGMNLNMYKNPDLTYLANQGVMMYNISLTTELGKKAAHIDLWKTFTIFFLENIISLTGIPVVFLGDEAFKYQRYLAPMQWRWKISHPASAAYTNSEWDSEGTFRRLDKILKDSNNEQISWWQEHK